jgi:hypothetical protein
MARAQKDLLSRLADAGEEAMHRLSEAPGADRVLGVANSLRERVDELQRRMGNVDEIERRLGALERRVDQLTGTGTSGRRRASGTTEARVSASKARTTARKTSGKSGSTTAKKSSSGSSGRAGGSSPG